MGSVSKTYFITTGSDPVAGALLDHLSSLGFSVYDDELSGLGTLVVFSTTHNKLKRAIKEARDGGLLYGPYKIRITEVKVAERPVFQAKDEFKGFHIG